MHDGVRCAVAPIFLPAGEFGLLFCRRQLPRLLVLRKPQRKQSKWLLLIRPWHLVKRKVRAAAHFSIVCGSCVRLRVVWQSVAVYRCKGAHAEGIPSTSCGIRLGFLVDCPGLLHVRPRSRTWRAGVQPVCDGHPAAQRDRQPASWPRADICSGGCADAVAPYAGQVRDVAARH